jgi:hypothetical protein
MDTNLIEAVIKQLGDAEYLEDAANHGADSGFPGFTYYSDTCQFFTDNKTEIIGLVKEMASEMDETPMDMVLGFRCLDKDDPDTVDEAGRALYGTPLEDDTQVVNALAWFALEEVARDYVDHHYEIA